MINEIFQEEQAQIHETLGVLGISANVKEQCSMSIVFGGAFTLNHAAHAIDAAPSTATARPAP